MNNKIVKNVFIAFIVVIAVFCSIPDHATELNPWTIFYQLVPQPPANQEVGSMGGFDRRGGAVVKELIVKPQISQEIDNIVAKFGKPDLISAYPKTFPLILPFKVLELNPKDLRGENANKSYIYYSLEGEIYQWGDITIFVKDKMARLIFVKGPEAENRVFASISERKQ